MVRKYTVQIYVREHDYWCLVQSQTVNQRQLVLTEFPQNEGVCARIRPNQPGHPEQRLRGTYQNNEDSDKDKDYPQLQHHCNTSRYSL